MSAAAESYGPSTAKRARRTRAEVEALRQAIYDVLGDSETVVTLRQLYYRLVAAQVIDKTQNEYRAVQRQLSLLRDAGVVPYSWIADSTRWVRKSRTYSSLTVMLEESIRTYRRDLWREQDAYVEVWVESDAFSGTLIDVTETYDVPMMVARGFSSKTYLHSVAQTIAAVRKPAFIYYFGDHDPSGVLIRQKVEAGLRQHAPEAEIIFEHLAVLPEQIEAFNLPTNPAKKSDPRAKRFQGGTVEIEALPPEEPVRLLRAAIEQHIDPDLLERTRRLEAEERETLERLPEILR